jgi:uncharacterized phiE125 gp8 family phage protein
MWEHLRVPLIGSPAEPVDKDHIAYLIAAARRYLDGRDGRLGRALITQTWELAIAQWPKVVGLNVPPVQSVETVEYLDPNGAAKTLDAGKYRVRGLNSRGPATVRPVEGETWPAIADDPEAITITFKAGYGDDPSDVPEPIRQAIRLLVADWYDKREASMAIAGLASIPTGVGDIIAQFREWEF